MRVLTAPNYNFSCVENTIFLAGSITGARNWQKGVEDSMRNTTYTVFNPRRLDFDTSNPEMTEQQIQWEFYHLKEATHVLFWFSAETVAPITLFEYGRELNRRNAGHIFVGTDRKYKRRDDIVIQTRLENPNVHVHNDLIDLVNEAKLGMLRT